MTEAMIAANAAALTANGATYAPNGMDDALLLILWFAITVVLSVVVVGVGNAVQWVIKKVSKRRPIRGAVPNKKRR